MMFVRVPASVCQRNQNDPAILITSDSLSATALGGIQPSDLGVRLVDAGGDLACIGASDYVQPILDGLNAKAAADSAFADKVTQSAIRVMTLKYSMGLAS